MSDTDPILAYSQHPYLEDDEPETWPEHDGQGPDVSNQGNERETEPNE